MKTNKNKGINLIALVITIIILLILAGISISALTQTGLFGKTKQAEQKSKEAQELENTTLGTYENEIDKYVGENSGSNPSEPSGEKLVDKVNDGTIKIGEYVKYTPDTVTNTDSKYTTLISNLGTYSGNTDSTKNTTTTLTQEMNLNWRVLDVKDGQVRLISDKPTTSQITLYGYNGYNNAVKLLDDTCNTLYNNSKLASKVQNLKIEDIQDKMVEKDYSKITSNYGTTYSPTNKYYPSILLKEKEQTVTIGEKTTTGTELGLSEQTELINQTTNTQVNSWIVKYTNWVKSMTANDFNDGYYELFINNGSNYDKYYLSSRCARADSSVADFFVRLVISGYVHADNLCESDGREFPRAFAFRPVITLNSNVQLDTANSGNGSTAEQGYAIK